LYLRKNLHVQQEEKIVDFTDPVHWVDELEKVLLSFNDTIGMVATYEYMQIKKDTSMFVVDSSWNNGSRCLLSVIPLSDTYQKEKVSERNAQVSSYNDFDQAFYYEAIARLLEMDQITPTEILPLGSSDEGIIPVPLIKGSFSSKETNAMLDIDKQGNISSKEINATLAIDEHGAYVYNHEISDLYVIPLNWRGYIAYTVNDFNIDDYTAIRMKYSGFLVEFMDSPENDSFHTQLVKIFHEATLYNSFLSIYPTLKRIYFDYGIDNRLRSYVELYGLSHEGEKLFTRKRFIERNANKIISNTDAILHNIVEE
jgi:hypothetical protein